MRANKLTRGSKRWRGGELAVRRGPRAVSPRGAWIVVNKTNMEVRRASPGFLELLRARKNDVQGMPVSALSSGAEGQEASWRRKAFTRRLLELPGRHEDIVLRASDGRKVVVDVLVSEAFGHRSPRVLCRVIDRTAHHQIESDLIGKFRDLFRVSTGLMRLPGEPGSREEKSSGAERTSAAPKLTTATISDEGPRG